MNVPGGWELIITLLMVLTLLVWVVWRVAPRSSRHGLAPLQPADDGEAVALARAALTSHWRSTVVPHEDGGWVVRTWTTTPTADSRPTGRPDFVHRVTARPGSSKLAAKQVHP